MRKKESRENKEFLSNYRQDYPPQERSYSRQEQYLRNSTEHIEKIPPQREKGTYYRSEYPEFPSQQQHKRSLFPLYLIGIISAICILLAGIILIVVLPQHKKAPTAQQTVTSIAKIPISTQINQVPPPKNTTSPNNCPSNVNITNPAGQPPLVEAAIHGRIGVARLLLDCGADVNAKDNDGFSPLAMAAWYGHVDVAQLLLDHGANVNVSDNNGFTPLHNAAAKGQMAVARLLLNRGADVNAKDNNGFTPLRYAVINKGHADVVALLRARGAHE